MRRFVVVALTPVPELYVTVIMIEPVVDGIAENAQPTSCSVTVIPPFEFVGVWDVVPATTTTVAVPVAQTLPLHTDAVIVC